MFNIDDPNIQLYESFVCRLNDISKLNQQLVFQFLERLIIEQNDPSAPGQQ